MIWKKPLTLPLQHTSLEAVGSNLVTGKKKFGTSFNCSHEGLISMLMPTFVSYRIPSHTTCSLLPRTFLPLFLLPLESLSKWLTHTWTHTDFPIFLFYSSAHKPSLGNSQFEHALWVRKNSNKPLFVITMSALPSSYFDLLLCWVCSS